MTHQGFRLWVDLGAGTLSKLQEFLSPLEVHAAVVSHAHPDHYLDLHMLFYARRFSPDPLPPLPVYMPPGAFDRIAASVGDRAQDMRKVFAIEEVEPGMALQVGPFHIRTRPMRHSLPTLGMRLEAGGSALAYTADTGPTEEILTIARDADLLLAESTYLTMDGRAPLHLTARQAGEFAVRAEVAGLILTHLWPTVDAEAARTEAASEFPGTIAVAEGGMRFDFPDPSP